ncbi:conserved hypothetical protein [Histoplasma mississippiense (nom. inval.)]|uniref:conserved hypothetical protein n=1 Tax=Ajellomyces capsulatus (strain NAm1 / WU24) TaxID=2059318 RepID=UPI000157C75B|nr:conserved hypothetical protein [Histoplasma mississippiense (nom. inval.)]EDN08426.1 conserved hypothetical protein [Histoplasma mississippiense (nom. inval.)]
MDKLQRQPLGSLLTKIRKSRVFLVGAGGIGCELLKNLVLTGFGEIHIVDLDTIDLSNLNRQFLFRQEHIKKPKALLTFYFLAIQVAKEVASKFRRDVSLHAYHANIKDPQFNVEFFESFDIVFNALDNLDARRHVNRMCLAANVPLIESGTTGFNGQVQVIKKGRTECYDCNAKQVPKSFPFGQRAIYYPEEIQNLQREAQALLSIRQSMGSDGFAEKVFTKVFNEDVDRLRKMEDMWKTRKPPQPLSFDPLQQEATAVDSTISSDDQKIWSLVENFAVFKDSLGRLSRRLQELEAAVTDGYKPVIAFDKDDVDTLDFVTASANLRSYIFGIEMKSKFEIKPIATTNAMTAAICVFQAFKVLKDEYGKAKMVFLERSGVRAINTANLSSPNPQCPVCSVAQGRVSIDLERATLDDLVQDVLRGQLGYGEELSINNQMGTIYDPDLDDNLPKKLKDLGVSNDSFLTVVDEEDENTRVNLDLLVSERPFTDPTTQPISLPSKPDIPRKPQLDMDLNTNGTTSTTNRTTTGKRKREADENPDDKEDKPTKRLATMSVADGDGDLAEKPIILEDDSGTILIDED